jgi:hypothetical protein
MLWKYHEYDRRDPYDQDKNGLDVFCLPAGIMDEDPDASDYEMPILKGLHLLVTKNIGEFRRVGLLENNESWERNAFEPFNKPT